MTQEYINRLADKFAARIERRGPQPARSFGEVTALQSGRFEETDERSNEGWGRMIPIYRIKVGA